MDSKQISTPRPESDPDEKQATHFDPGAAEIEVSHNARNDAIDLAEESKIVRNWSSSGPSTDRCPVLWRRFILLRWSAGF